MDRLPLLVATLGLMLLVLALALWYPLGVSPLIVYLGWLLQMLVGKSRQPTRRSTTKPKA